MITARGRVATYGKCRSSLLRSRPSLRDECYRMLSYLFASS
jgi:hypothetical protein